MNDSDGPVAVRLHLAGSYRLLPAWPARQAGAPDTLAGGPVLVVANGGCDRHAPVVDHQLRPDWPQATLRACMAARSKPVWWQRPDKLAAPFCSR